MTFPVPFFTWPDGGDVLSERFIENTAFETAYDGTEHRRIARAFPRYGIAGSFVLFDEENDTLGEIEDGRPVLVPAWMHALPARAGGLAPLVPVIHGPGDARPFAVRTSAGSFDTLSAPVAGTPPAIVGSAWLPHLVAFPLVPMRFDADAVELQVEAPGARTLSLSFITDALDEPLPAYEGPLSQGLPLLQLRTGSAKPTQQTAFNANAFDAGNLATWELRHKKRSIGVTFRLWGREEILAFRLFMRQLRGRYQAFRWSGFDGVERTYRLAADQWDLKYTGTHSATCALRLVEL